MTSLAVAWTDARARRAARPRRTPLLLLFVSWLARTLPGWKRARTAVMQWAAFTALTIGMFSWSVIAGCVSICVSLLVLEALGGSER